MVFSDQILTGVIAGIISAGIIYFLGLLMKRVIIPELKTWMFKYIVISGKWITYDDNIPGAQIVGYANFKQRGDKVYGTIVRQMSRNKPLIPAREFKIKGKLTNGQLVLTFEEEKFRGYITGAIIMKLSSDGNLLSGMRMYVNQNNGKVKTGDYYFKRH